MILSSKSYNCHHHKFNNITVDLRRPWYLLLQLLCIQTTTLASKIVQLIRLYDSRLEFRVKYPVFRIIPAVTNVEPKKIIDLFGHFKWYIIYRIFHIFQHILIINCD